MDKILCVSLGVTAEGALLSVSQRSIACIRGEGQGAAAMAVSPSSPAGHYCTANLVSGSECSRLPVGIQSQQQKPAIACMGQLLWASAGYCSAP